MISTLTYVSRLQDSVGRDELEVLLEVSRGRNAAEAVTGLLLVRDRQVMQILEGEESTIQDLYARIRRDPRHRDVTQVWRSSSRSRRFPEWSMGFEDLSASEPLGAEGSPTDLTATDDAGAYSFAGDQRLFLNRRMALLRRGLASGNRLISSLAVILDAHEGERFLSDDGSIALQCRQGCTVGSEHGVGYPCYTAQNAFWALDATL